MKQTIILILVLAMLFFLFQSFSPFDEKSDELPLAEIRSVFQLEIDKNRTKIESLRQQHGGWDGDLPPTVWGSVAAMLRKEGIRVADGDMKGHISFGALKGIDLAVNWTTINSLKNLIIAYLDENNIEYPFVEVGEFL